MKITGRLCFAYVLFSLVASSASLLAQSRVPPAAAVHSETISAGWSFRLLPGDPAVTAHPGAAGWEPATVPSSVQMDLLQGKTVSRGLLFFAPAVKLTLPVTQVKTARIRAGDHFELTVSSDTIAREVWLSFGQLDATLSDNAFDLLPGESRTIQVHSAAKLGEIKEALRSRSLVDATQAASDHHALGAISASH